LGKSHNIKKRAIVIGSGVGGLASAARLAAKGADVTVFEKNNSFGGKVSLIEKAGYRWGFGASLLTLPELIDEVFIACGKKPSDYYHYQRIDPICRYFYPDGTVLDAFAEPARFASEVERKTGEPGSQVLAHLKRAEKVFELTKDIFLYQSLHKWSTYINRNSLRSIWELPAIGIFKNMHRANQESFKDPRVVQLFDRYATYNGSDPYRAPSTLNVIGHPEYNMGAYFMEGGMPAVTQSLYKLCLDMGVKFEFGTKVGSVKVSNGRVSGVMANEQFQPADIVVSNMDVVYTYTHLMPEQKAPKRVIDAVKSTSAIIFYWGIKGTFAELDLHNIFFSADYEREFEYINDKRAIWSDPTVYVYISSKKQKDHAPEGCENWFVLVNVPHDTGQDWAQVVADTRRDILSKLKTALGADIESRIMCESVNHPRSIQDKTLSYRGALYGNSSNDLLAAFLRHPNFSGGIKGLYFCGGSVHPGGGVPLCLLSAKIIDELVR